MIGRNKTPYVNHLFDIFRLYDINILAEYNRSEIEERLKTYYKFSFVRHPMERLLSAYRSKFEKRSDNDEESQKFYRTYNTSIMSQFGTDFSHSNESMTFAQFLNFTISQNIQKNHTNEHWNVANNMCYFCDIDYNFVGFFDNFRDDIAYVLNKIYPKEKRHWFPTIPRGPDSTKRLLSKYLTQVPPKLLQDIKTIFEKDFMLFDFV